MALVQYGGGVTEITGSIGGNTFQRSSAGTIVRARVASIIPKSNISSNVLSQSASLTSAWRNLGPDYVREWNAFAAAHPRQDIFGKSKKLSGHGWFKSINSQRLLASQSVINDPPTYALPSSYVFDDVAWTSTEMYLDIDPLTVVTGETGVLYTTPPCKTLSSIKLSQLRQTHVYAAVSSMDTNILSDWATVHNLTVPINAPTDVYVMALFYTILNSSGMVGVAVYAPGDYKNS